jgi:hypothetical protein
MIFISLIDTCTCPISSYKHDAHKIIKHSNFSQNWNFYLAISFISAFEKGENESSDFIGQYFTTEVIPQKRMFWSNLAFSVHKTGC